MNAYQQRFKTTEQRFWEKVDKTGDCWNWTAGTHAFGYGRFWVDGKTIDAHRYVLILDGSDIPSGMQVCHHCDNPRCVNPDHLYIGTQADNMRDRDERGRHPGMPVMTGEEHPKAKLTEADVRVIRSMIGLSARRLAKMFGVSHTSINDVLHRRSWSHVADA